MAEYRATPQVRVNVKLDPHAVEKLLTNVKSASVYRAARVTASRMQDNIKAAGRVDTGRMLRSVKATRPEDRGRGVTASTVGITGKAAKYAGFQEYGTRDHGPVKAQFLVFKPKGSGTFVFAKHVRGVKAAHFARDAYRKLTLNDFLP